jgi:hypothetical protein
MWNTKRPQLSMENKNQSKEIQVSNILLKINWASSIELLNDKERSSILTNIFNYHTDKPLVKLSKSANMLFSSMIEVFEFNKVRYQKKVEANIENGKKGGRMKKNPTNPNGLIENPENPKEKDKSKGIDRDIVTVTDEDTERDISTGRIKETDPRFEKYYMQKFIELLNINPDSLSDRDERMYAQRANHYHRKLGPENFSKLIFQFKSEDAKVLIDQYDLENNLDTFDFIRYNMIGYLRKLVK